MKRVIYISISLLLFITYLIIPSVIYANSEYVSYSVKAILPENQIDHNHSYFNLRVEPNDVQELQTEIFNNENEDISVHLSVRNSSTNQNGVIVYEDTEMNDSNWLPQLTDMVTFEEETVVIPAGESKIASATLQVPDQRFDGEILGGLHFEKELTDDVGSEGVKINNKYAYLVGVVLSQNEEEVPVDLQLKEVKADIVNHRTANVISIENTSPNIVEGLAIDVKIYKDKDQESIKEKYQEHLNMAPYSTMDFVIDWDKKNRSRYISSRN